MGSRPRCAVATWLAVVVAVLGVTDGMVRGDGEAGARNARRPQRIKLKAPEGGGLWAAGSPVEIRWRRRAQRKAVRRAPVVLEFSRDLGATWREIGRSEQGERSLRWVVEEELGEAWVRVRSENGREVSRPKAVEVVSPPVQIEIAHNFGVALHADGRLRLWGWFPDGVWMGGETTWPRPRDFPGVPGEEIWPRPRIFPGLSNVASVTAGGLQFLAVLDDGTVWYWGQTGADYGRSSPPVSEPTRLEGIDDAIWARAEAGRSFIKVADGRVFGVSGWPQGNGPMWNDPDAPLNTPIEIPELRQCVDIQLGADHGLGLLEDGTVVAWGSNSWAQLGEPGASARSSPEPVPGIRDAVQIAAGPASSMVLRKDGTVLIWGSSPGRLSNYVDWSPVPVAGLERIVFVEAIAYAGYALRDDGALFAWGNNSRGQLGLGHHEEWPEPRTPIRVPVPPVQRLSTGNDATIHVLTTDGRRFAWGYNFSYDVGDGQRSDVLSPRQIYSP